MGEVGFESGSDGEGHEDGGPLPYLIQSGQSKAILVLISEIKKSNLLNLCIEGDVPQKKS